MAGLNFEALLPDLFLNEHTSQAYRGKAGVGGRECKNQLPSCWLFSECNYTCFHLVQDFQGSASYFILATFYKLSRNNRLYILMIKKLRHRARREKGNRQKKAKGFWVHVLCKQLFLQLLLCWPLPRAERQDQPSVTQ